MNCAFFWGPGFFADILHKDLNLKTTNLKDRFAKSSGCSVHLHHQMNSESRYICILKPWKSSRKEQWFFGWLWMNSENFLPWGSSLLDHHQSSRQTFAHFWPLVRSWLPGAESTTAAISTARAKRWHLFGYSKSTSFKFLPSIWRRKKRGMTPDSPHVNSKQRALNLNLTHTRTTPNQSLPQFAGKLIHDQCHITPQMP